MAVIIDRRFSSSGKNHTNRQKFLERVKRQIKTSVQRSIKTKSIKDIADGKDVIVNSKDISEPIFSNDENTGSKEVVRPGNDKYSVDDSIPKPGGSSGRGRGNEGSPDGDGSDDFSFVLSKEEFLSYLFDDLELPDFVKQSITVVDSKKWSKSGFVKTGSPANLNIERTFKKSIGRRLALGRPDPDEIATLELRIKELLETNPESEELKELEEKLRSLKNRMKTIPFIDENDLQYSNYEEHSKPSSQAVMFCIMDVSGSMGESEKDISKRFFLLLYLFLERRYDKIDIIFIRHTHEAEEVDEDTFFYDTVSGGTMISSALKLTQEIISKRYNLSDWNVYISQCSDGDNYSSDNTKCKGILENLLTFTQFYAYIQISSMERQAYSHPFLGTMSMYTAWGIYQVLADSHKNMECRMLQDKSEVWKVFRSLFEKRQ